MSLATGALKSNLKPGLNTSEVLGIRNSYSLVNTDEPKSILRKIHIRCYGMIFSAEDS